MENRDRVVSKDELIDKIWHGRIVSEIDPDQPDQCRAQGDRRQRQRAGADPHHRAQGLSFRRRRADAARRQPRRSRCRAREPQHAPLPLPDRPAIAVLPFTNMSGDREQEYFSDGISEDIITALSKLRWFFVIARNSSFVYKGRAVHITRSRASSACATCSKAACGAAAIACASPRSSTTSRPAAISGPSATTASLPTSSPCRTRSPRRSSPRSSRSSMPPRAFAPSRNRREASTPGTS